MEKLSEKQTEIVELMARGKTKKEMAIMMGVSLIRIHQQKSEIRRKMEMEVGDDINEAIERYAEWYHKQGE